MAEEPKDPLDKEFRRTYLGASDIPIIMGVSPWMTVGNLFLEKSNLEDFFHENEHTRRGKECEPIARQFLEEQLGLLFPPEFCRHRDISYLAANLDGYSKETKTIVEIKVPTKAVVEKIREEGIPLMYQYQMCDQLMCKQEAEKMLFFVFDTEEGDHILQEFVPPDGMKEEILDEASYFWKCVQTGTPPEGAERDYPEYNNPELYIQCDLLQEYQDKASEYDKKAKAMKQKIIESIGGESAKIAQFVMEKQYRRGAIDYSKIPALKGMDLEPYRKEKFAVWKLR